MDIRPEPIVFTITEQGRLAALSAEEYDIQLKLSHFAVGGERYFVNGNETELKSEFIRVPIVSGGVEEETKTLRFSATLKSESIKYAYEVGLFTEDGVLFAIAASNGFPLFTIHANISFVASFGLSLNNLNTSTITVVTNPDGSIAAAMMQDHLASSHPHDQYLKEIDIQPILDRLDKLEADLEKARVKVGGILTTSVNYANSDELSEDIGYGEWQLYAEGRTLVGLSTLESDPEWKKTIGIEFGADEHTLTNEEMPIHKHKLSYSSGNTGGSDNITGSPGSGDVSDSAVSSAGGGQPHNNVQKSKVVAHWIRVA